LKILKKIEKINLYIPIYPDAGIGIEDIEFSEKYKISVERAGREIITNAENSAHSYFLNKCGKLIRL
jgi:hypothetical protein